MQEILDRRKQEAEAITESLTATIQEGYSIEDTED
jgi:hypothetical protein